MVAAKLFCRIVAPCIVLAGICRGPGAETVMNEYQVKALFLLNFTKYVDWPAASFADANTPITIDLVAGAKFGEVVKLAAEGKTVLGRRVVVELIEKGKNPQSCHVLFISGSEKRLLSDLLKKTKGLSVLTVGEDDQFLEQGGVIQFVKKAERIRLEINLDAAREAKLQISSKLLNVADAVRGRDR